MYTKMVTTRRFEEKMGEMVMSGELTFGAMHTYDGEEAVAIGVCANLRPDDRLTSTHRPDGHAIAKGMDLKKLAAEIFGKKTGFSKGKGGNMHLYDMSVGMLGSFAICGSNLPVSLGAGLAAKFQGTKQVSVGFFGDGAAQQGALHECLNMASIWKLPVVFVCENNLYAVSSPARERLGNPDVGAWASSYRMPGAVVDGQDVRAVYEATRTAVERARRGDGPSLIECKTYRFHGHIYWEEVLYEKGMPYRTQEEVDKWKQRDPITIFEALLEKRKFLSKQDVARIKEAAHSAVEQAATFALESPYPDPEEALEDLFV